MQRLYIRLAFIFAALALLAWSIYPPETKLRLGKDLAGGVSLVYGVTMAPGDNPTEVMNKTIDVIKERVDPQGIYEISVVAQGKDRIEITMPLPTDKVKKLRENFEAELAQAGKAGLEPGRLDEAMALPAAQRAEQIKDLAGSDADRAKLLDAAAKSFDSLKTLRDQYAAATDAAQKEQLASQVAQADLDYTKARDAVLATALPAKDLHRVFNLSDTSRTLTDADGSAVKMPSPRQKMLDDLHKRFPGASAKLDKLVAMHADYEKSRTTLDDPNDLIRLLRGAGVLSFRISVNPGGGDGGHPEEARLRQELRERGPRNVKAVDAKWCKINRIDTWYESVQQLNAIQANASGYFASRGYVVEEKDGEYWMLCWDTREMRLTANEGQWQVKKSSASADSLGRPAIAFEMNPKGAVLLGGLTRINVGKKMAVLFDDQVYTAPTLQSAISANGQITGEFSQEEINYIVRVLGAGSLQAKLSTEPISTEVIGPELGKDNLDKGLATGLWTFVWVSIFMIVYYFTSGIIAVVALAVAGVFILGVMAINKAAFSLPGIAGIVLTFGQAVDANVLIYERMREELRHGIDLKHASKTGFSKALPAILDANAAHLIICAVLYNLGTQEIKGFALTLAIGVIATLFSALFVSRVIFDLLITGGIWKKTSMLPMAVPALQRLLEPHVNWLRLRPLFIGISTIAMIGSIVLCIARGDNLFDTAFRGGTQITLQLGREHGAQGEVRKNRTMTRAQAEERLRKLDTHGKDDKLDTFAKAEVIPINPASDGVTSEKFKFKTTVVDNQKVIAALNTAFGDVVDTDPVLTFDASKSDKIDDAPIYRVLSASLSEVIPKAGVPAFDVAGYRGGIAILLDKIDPPQSLDDLNDRLERTRLIRDYSDTLERQREVRMISGTTKAVTSAVVLVSDPNISAYDNEATFDREVAKREWSMTREALTQPGQVASVENFSPTVARTFKANAVISLGVSIVLLIIYIWVRYGTVRWSLAATLPLLHDVVTLIGFLALAQVLYETPATQKFASALGILPFGIDLNMVAAILTMAGFSLNDKIIILDRIRENRGKAKYATGPIINDSINQTLSRTMITSGTTLISTIILYTFGGEAIRGFAYAFNLGVIIGTYSSIAIAAPLVWSKKDDDSASSEYGSAVVRSATRPSPTPIGAA